MGREIYDIINDMAEVLNASQMAKETKRGKHILMLRPKFICGIILNQGQIII